MRLNTDDVLPPGYRLHWYQLQSLIGDGGFGITYLGRDTNLNQSVAIKEFFPKSVVQRAEHHQVVPSADADPEFFHWGLQRFLDEARLLARFRHPHIVRVLSVFETLGTAFMVMELERGESVADVIKSDTAVTEDQALDLVMPLLDGLELVHDAGFIHRDIKPTNILLRPGLGPVLIDFGSARQPHPGQSAELTAIVSRGYAPFEQYDAGIEQRQGPWSDIYGLAATLYHIMTGGPMVDALTRGMCLLNGDPDPFVPATVCAPGRYSARLLGAVDRGLAFKSCDRPQSIEDWRELFPAHSGVRRLRHHVRTEALDQIAETAVVLERLHAAKRQSDPDNPPEMDADPWDDDTTVRNPVAMDTEHLQQSMLVVDDERSSRTLIQRVLSNLGATQVDVVDGAQPALARIDAVESAPQVLLLDLEMPGMDGVQLLRELATRGVRTPLVLLADGDERLLVAARHLARAHGLVVLGTVRKPVTPDRLSKVLARIGLEPPRDDSERPSGGQLLCDDTVREGIASNALELVYLPKVSVKERELLGVEALVRWPGLEADVTALVAQVEALGLADAFTEQVLRKALVQAGLWRAEGLACGISINVFATFLARLDLPELLVGIAEAEGVTPRDVTLEVNEMRLQARSDVPLEVLTRLRLRGMGLAIDDFGTGTSTLERLRAVPFTELKVDRSFVASACEERTSRVILESSVTIARRLGLQAVAEGVGDEGTLELVTRLGFDAAQGYHLCPPLPPQDLADWSRDWCLGRRASDGRAEVASA